MHAFFSFLSDIFVLILSLEGNKFIIVRQYYVLPSLNKDSSTTNFGTLQ